MHDILVCKSNIILFTKYNWQNLQIRNKYNTSSLTSPAQFSQTSAIAHLQLENTKQYFEII